MQESPERWRCVEERDDFTDKTIKWAEVRSATGERLVFEKGTLGTLELALDAPVEPGSEGNEYRISLRVDDGRIFDATDSRFVFGRLDDPSALFDSPLPLSGDLELIEQMRHGRRIRARYFSESGKETATFSLEGFESAFLETFGRSPSTAERAVQQARERAHQEHLHASEAEALEKAHNPVPSVPPHFLLKTKAATAASTFFRVEVWQTALAVLSIAILGYGALFSSNTRENVAFLAGYYFGFALISWIAFRFALLRRRGIRINAIAFAAILVSLIASGLISAEKHRRAAAAAISSIRSDLDRVAAAVDPSSQTSGHRNPEPFDRPRLSGDEAKAAQLMRDLVDELLAIRADYVAGLESIGWNRLFDASRLRTDPQLVQSRRMLESARQLHKSMTARAFAVVEGLESRADSYQFSASNRRAVREEMRGPSFATNVRNMNAQFARNGEILDLCEGIIDLLASGTEWTVKGNQILFANQHDLSAYNAHIQGIQHIVEQQQREQKRVIEAFTNHWDKLQREANE